MGDFLQTSGFDPGVQDTNDDTDRIFGAETGTANVISDMYFGYSSGPGAGTVLKIYDGDGTNEAQVIFQIPVNADGFAFPINFDPHRKGTVGHAMVVRLTSGGAGVTGYLNVGHYRQG